MTDVNASISGLPRTIAELPFFVGGRYLKSDLLGRCDAERVVTIGGRELVDQVRDLGLGLETLGLARGARVALLAESRPDWLVADLAILTAGAVTVPIYPTLSSDQVGFILRDAEVSLAVASTDEQCRKILDVARSLPSLKAVVVMDRAAVPSGETPIPVVPMPDVLERGHRRLLDAWGVGKAFQDGAKAVQPEDLATVIYTSGTTGDPKGVMLTHRNIMANIEGVNQVLVLGQEDAALSFLPLCHAFERTVSYVYLVNGVSIIFAESVDTIGRDLRRVRPTVMTGVPRVFEKLYARVLARGEEATGLRRRLFGWALAVAGRRGAALEDGGRPSAWLSWQSRIADGLVFQKVRDGLGGRLRLAVSGSAPLRTDLARLFLGMGLPVLEGYGLTETAPVLTVTPLDRIRFGKVGRALPNVDLRLADDGEVLARGPNVMAGYYNRPADTAEVIRDGWFHTGDIGTLDADGYLSITDRKKELIVTSGGKNIAPQPIEEALRAHPLVAEAALLGDRRHFVSALIVPGFEELSRRLGQEPPADETAARALLERPDAQSAMQAAVDEVNARLARYEQIKRFSALARPFSLESGELTPTLKVKRRVVEERYRDVIDAMYASEPVSKKQT